MASITDHLGHQLNFGYYDDGNLLSITEAVRRTWLSSGTVGP